MNPDQSNHFTTAAVVVTICIAVVIGVATMSYMAMTQTPIPDPFDRMVTFMAGSLTTLLAKAGIEKAINKVTVDEESTEVTT